MTVAPLVTELKPGGALTADVTRSLSMYTTVQKFGIT